MRNENILILFIKAPQLCRVKTRLWPELNHRECLSLYRLLTHNTIKQLINSNQYKLVVYSTAADKTHSLPFRLSIKYQQGPDLGMRMHHAISQELKNAQRVVLIGSDCLHFTSTSIEHAFNQLDNNNDIVITPTHDGGYCLIGMRRAHRTIFDNISWSSSEVLYQTIHAAEKSGKAIKILEAMHDIDTMNDLHELKKLGQLPGWAQQYIR